MGAVTWAQLHGCSSTLHLRAAGDEPRLGSSAALLPSWCNFSGLWLAGVVDATELAHEPEAVLCRTAPWMLCACF